MPVHDEVGEFAALLREFKGRTDRSYGALARRLAMNTSTLHRYCAGDTVPLDFAPVERFAALCGASPQERLELHRRWLRAVAARQRPRGAAATGPEEAPATAAVRRGDADAPAAPASGPTGPDDTTDPTEEPGGATHPGATDRSSGPGGAAGRVGEADAVAEGAGAPDASAAAGCEPAAVRIASGAVASGGPVLPRPRLRRGRVAVAVAAVCALVATLGSLAALPDGRPAAGHAGAAGPSPGTTAAAGGPPPGSTASASPADPTGPARTAPSGGSGRTSPAASAAPTGNTGGPGDADGSRGSGQEAPAVPLAWTADSHAWEQGCGHDYVIAGPPARVPPPPAPQDARTWAAAQNAVHGGETLVEISVQGRGETAVVLRALRVRVVGRTAPAEGSAYAMDQGCGGALTPRHFAVDLDKDRPLARSVAGNDAGTPIPAVRLPYRVSAREPEVLRVTARTGGCDCRWYLELDWSSQDRSGTVRIDDRGRPFRTSAVEGLPAYTYDTSGRRWVADAG
ncbi:helix-turn-helix domain-containing protein [Streptomyces sp. NPDC085946]|uniref:helix-turn-helix domain-containing protein n=1 Tax=Streptomyces sp. NPDC085946 TaxID=3365744 RepID=UPI0037D10DCD